jgi:two-component system, LytTR family, sensor histidine kinase AlgZ
MPPAVLPESPIDDSPGIPAAGKTASSSADSPAPANGGKAKVLPTEQVIPDCCNIGVIFRVLLAVNAVVLLAMLLHANTLRSGLVHFVELSILIELACLSSLLALCATRNLLRMTAPWCQRMACAVVPMGVSALISSFLLSLNIFFTFADPFKSALIAGLFGAALQHYFELRTRAFSPALAEARLQALQARIRPHFLFNSLNAVLSLIRSEPRQAEEALEDLAELFRALLRDARDLTTLEEEIRLCRQYLSIEKIRLGDRLQVRWHRTDISDSVLRKAQIPSLLLQPLLENAVHYGVEPASKPVQIQIHLSRSIDRIEISVINPYPGEGESTGNHMALDNIRQRLALLYDVEAQLTTTAARGFFAVRVRFPYVKVAE